MIVQTELKTNDLTDEIWNLGSGEFADLSANLTSTVESLFLQNSFGKNFKEANVSLFEKDIAMVLFEKLLLTFTSASHIWCKTEIIV